ncbi:MAG: hypothetical protein IPP07_18525 [Holophagales bacterium]|nr:hypothetical protein [Holophagales bacterium]
MGRRERKGAAPSRGRVAGGAGWSASRKALLAVAVVLVACADDRQVGRIGDARQVVQTAVAIATTGEVGVARGIQLSAIPRPGGDAVARYGLGMSLAQLPASALAPSFEKAFGPGGSQSLFLLAPLALLPPGGASVPEGGERASPSFSPPSDHPWGTTSRATCPSRCRRPVSSGPSSPPSRRGARKPAAGDWRGPASAASRRGPRS